MTAYPSPPGEKPPKYPWDQWFDGQEWTLDQGRDYWGGTERMIRSVLGAASQRRVVVVVYSTRLDPFVRLRKVRDLPPKETDSGR